MALDLEKLSLPWRTYNSGSCDYIAGAGSDYPLLLPEDEGEKCRAAVAFAVLASQAFDGDPEASAWWEANRKKRDHA